MASSSWWAVSTGRNTETNGLTWAELAKDDVLVGELDPDYVSRLGVDPDEGQLVADLHVAPDITGRILLRIPEALLPDDPSELGDMEAVWEPDISEDGQITGGRGFLHYRTRKMDWGEYYLEITAEEDPFGTY